ncbi:MAG: HAD hydrolase-like protein, partial [Clostridia bacterium]|nr:HAD hydrolase-like protein [Clostridia bacterium]
KMGATPPSERALKSCIGPPLLQSFLAFFDGDKRLAEQGVTVYRERYQTLGWTECSLYDGVKECLAALTGAGKKIGLATSKPTVFAEKILAANGLSPYFSVVVGSKLDNSFDDKGQIIARALSLFGAKAEDCVMVGDRKQDVSGAKKNGVLPVGVRVGFAAAGELEDAGAAYVADDFFALKELLLSL